jgi:hypothetical protein
VSTEVNSVQNNHPGLKEPIPAEEVAAAEPVQEKLL